MKNVLPVQEKYGILSAWENHRAKGGLTPLVFVEGSDSPSDERKEGDNNVRYIYRFDPNWYIHCCPC